MAQGPQDERGGPRAASDAPESRPYEPPAIVWEERYEPVGFGISCAQQQGNTGCFPGPVFS